MSVVGSILTRRNEIFEISLSSDEAKRGVEFRQNTMSLGLDRNWLTDNGINGNEYPSSRFPCSLKKMLPFHLAVLNGLPLKLSTLLHVKERRRKNLTNFVYS